MKKPTRVSIYDIRQSETPDSEILLELLCHRVVYAGRLGQDLGALTA
jgi:hypothetical protein